MADNYSQFSDSELSPEELSSRFPKFPYWIGAAPTHPLINPMHMPYAVASQAAGTAPPKQVSVPHNTGATGPRGIRSLLRLPVDIIFGDAKDRICAHADVVPESTQLTYKLSGSRARDEPVLLSGDDDWEDAKQRLIGKITRSRGADMLMEIHIPTPPAAAPTTPATPNTTGPVNELRQLKERLFCQQHSRHCYVHPTSFEHINLDVFKLTLWARKISQGEATLDRPPTCSSFDFSPKRATRSRRAGASSTLPPIHVHLPPYPSAPHPAPASTQRDVIDLSRNPNASPDDTEYPPIDDAVYLIHSMASFFDLPQYIPALHAAGVETVDNVCFLSPTVFTDIVGIPDFLVGPLISQSLTLVRETRKGKGPAAAVKEEFYDEMDE
ncbi:hypothetical protein BDN72DRAFT_948678 [Pluteus cervinus]|uniref:Uncharacterized protein n=1 Tax=Pluteus cervinus TaxID=181527 RepID=A0ACD3ASU4_9AGAR|nr:hypothetical protein BDN72DRAFT_948678 [Pluteus cervinus]